MKNGKSSLTMKSMTPGTRESIFTTEFTEDTEVKTESANCSGDSRNNSLTQCIIFISFMNFMVKKAVLCDLLTLGLVPRLRDVLCGEKCIYLVFLF